MSDPNDHFVMIRDQAERFLSDTMQPEYLKGLLERPGTFDKKNWDGAVALGWPATSLTEEHGGLGLGWRGVCVLAEEMGRKIASLPLVGTAALAELLLTTDSERAHEYAASLVSGERYACLAVTQAGEAGLAFSPRMRLCGDKLSGTTALTPFAATADYALVPAQEDGALCLTIVPLDQPGVRRQSVAAIDNSRAVAVLTFHDAIALPVAKGALAKDRLWNLIGIVALAMAFEQIGGAQTCMEMARDYALERKAFGQPIGRFQAIKAKLADIYISIEMARGCALDALIALEQGDAGWLGLAASARVSAITAYEIAARENIQTHGAIGVTWEAMPHHHYRRSRVLAVEIGSAATWREHLLSEIGIGLAT